jgi:hypothetical protein
LNLPTENVRLVVAARESVRVQRGEVLPLTTNEIFS